MFIEKIKNFFKRLFKRNKVIQIEQKDVSNSIKEKNNIRDTLYVGKERLELFKLQEKYEKNELDVYQLSRKQLQNLVKLYEEQIRELNGKLGKTKNSEI